jgi:repressor LexA
LVTNRWHYFLKRAALQFQSVNVADASAFADNGVCNEFFRLRAECASKFSRTEIADLTRRRIRLYIGTDWFYIQVPSMRELTPRQKQILTLLQKVMQETGMPPTRAEIAKTLKFRSVNAAEEHLRALERKGVLELLPGTSRGIRLKDSLREQIGLPLVGRVAAGQPILAEEHIEARYQIDPDLFRKPPHFLLRVHGMSMRDAGILDGDLVAVHRTPDVRARQIVVARLENEVTVKRYRQEGHRVWLMPENPEFAPIQVDLREQSLAIEGIVVGVVRDSMK